MVTKEIALILLAFMFWIPIAGKIKLNKYKVRSTQEILYDLEQLCKEKLVAVPSVANPANTSVSELISLEAQYDGSMVVENNKNIETKITLV